MAENPSVIFRGELQKDYVLRKRENLSAEVLQKLKRCCTGWMTGKYLWYNELYAFKLRITMLPAIVVFRILKGLFVSYVFP
jgi:hypothetical protein